YVPVTMDFRGRLYGISHFNFQREDNIRGLFLFADGERIGDKGLAYLKAHTAKAAGGNSGLNLEQRIAWTDQHIDYLYDTGSRALCKEAVDDEFIRGLDDPFQFIAARVELTQALDGGPDFITRLPVTFDGCCSGLQHLTAMTCAEEGKFVNLTANATREDIYGRVADMLSVDRAIAKRPVMTYFYGSGPGGFRKNKPYGMTEQIFDALTKQGLPTDDAEDLAHKVYAAIEKMVPHAAAVRDFLQELADLCSWHGKPLRWRTPLGLPVINHYQKPKIVRVPTYLMGKLRRFNLVVGDTDEIDRSAARNAATANFVHSIDAAHMQMVANAAAMERIQMVGVHDCFGCIAPHAERFNQIIREQFVRLHTQYDLLGGVLDSVRRDLRTYGLPAPPPKGTLDVREVLRSFFAFA